MNTAVHADTATSPAALSAGSPPGDGEGPSFKIPAGYLAEATVAEVLGVKVQCLRKWAVYRKGLPRTKLGKRVIYREESFNAWMAAQETNPADARKGA